MRALLSIGRFQYSPQTSGRVWWDTSLHSVVCWSFTPLQQLGCNIRMVTDLWQCALMVALWCWPTGKSGSWQNDSKSHSVTLGLTSPYPILLMPSIGHGVDKNQVYKSLVWLDWEPNYWSSVREAHSLLIQPPRPVPHSESVYMCREAQILWESIEWISIVALPVILEQSEQ